MSKAVTKGKHWLPRHSQYSLHGQRNGRVDILPPHAKMPTFGELRQRYNDMKLSYAAAQRDYVRAKGALELAIGGNNVRRALSNDDGLSVTLSSKHARKVDQLREKQKVMCGLAARLQDYKTIFFEAKDTKYERAWIATAKAMLPHDVVDQIERVVSAHRAADYETLPESDAQA